MSENHKQELRHQLKKETHFIMQQKEETWAGIQQELFPKNTKKVYWKRRLTVTFGMVAAAAIVIVMTLSGTFTNDMAKDPMHSDEQGIPGSPNESNDPDHSNENLDESPENTLADEYEDEKQMEIELEGMKEPITMKLAVNEEARYIIYLEKDQYELIQGSGADREEDWIQLTGKPDERYPSVAMVIRKQTDTTLEEQIEYVKQDIKEDGMTVFSEEEVSYPLEAYRFILVKNDTQEWDDPVHYYYISDMGDGTYFLFKQIFFQEASEGVGARFDFMLETFEYVGED